MSLRAAIIGCGRIGCGGPADAAGSFIYTHAAAFAAASSAELVAVCDVDGDVARASSARWKVPRWYTDPREMLRESAPDLVSICTPDASHPAMLALALAARSTRGVVLEKPVALCLADARRAERLAAESTAVVAVNYTRRYVSSHVALREKLASGSLGGLQSVTGYYTKGMLHNGTHWIDLARFLCGEVVEVTAFAGAAGPGGDPSYDARLRFETGLRGNLIGCDSKEFSLFEMDLVGTRGRVRLLDSGLTVETAIAGPSAVFEGYTVLQAPERTEPGFDDPTLHVIEDLIEAIQTGRPARCSLVDGVQAVAIADAIGEAARLGCSLRVDPPS